VRRIFLTGAFVCALGFPTLGLNVARAQDAGLPNNVFGVPEITGTIGNTALDGFHTVSLENGVLTVKDGLGTYSHTLTRAEAQALVNDVNGADLSKVPSDVKGDPGLMGATAFDLTFKTADGHTYTRQGNLVDLAKYPGFQKLVTDFNGDVATATAGPVTPVVKAPDPAKTKGSPGKFDGATLLLKGTLGTDLPGGGDTQALTVKPDGSYVYAPTGARAPISGKLSAAELGAIEKAFATSDFAKLPANMPGAIPDTTQFTLTADGKSVSGYANGAIAAPGGAWTQLQPLLDSLEGVANRLDPDPPIAHPIDRSDGHGKGGILSDVGHFFSGVGNSVARWFSSSSKTTVDARDTKNGDGIARSAGLDGILQGQIDAAADASKGDDADGR
jgi:hypothetical protein